MSVAGDLRSSNPATATIATIYRPLHPAAAVGARAATGDEVIERAVAATGDEHAIKFTGVAMEFHHRGNPHALASAAHAEALIREK